MADDPNFNISAAVVRQLGEELVSDEVTAIMELIKNSYDADADWVNITINTKESLPSSEYHFSEQKGYIIIEDDGFGMNEKELKEGWFIISLSSKRSMKANGEKTPKGRTPLGDKGLGRLSTQRLGSKLEMLTGKKDETKDYHVAFDWNDFVEEKTLTAVPTHFKSTPKEEGKEGTKLAISNLRDAKRWKGKSAFEFIGQLSQLIFPYKDQRPFDVYITINNEEKNLDNIREDLRDVAQSRFSFKFEENILTIKGKVRLNKLRGLRSEDNIYEKYILADSGKDFFDFLTDPDLNKNYFLNDLEYSGNKGWLYSYEQTYNFKKLDQLALIYDSKTKRQKKLANPGPFYGEIDDFDLRKSDLVESAFDSLSEYKKIVKNQLGIRIFRNGFGIKPFGLDGNDWLNLGGSQTSGGSYYHLRPGNVIGFIKLSADSNSNLKEKTDREGFIDNPYSKNFFLLADKVVDTINLLLENTRRSFNEFKQSKAQENAGIKSIKDSYKRLHEASKMSKELENKTTKILTELSETSDDIDKIIEKNNTPKQNLSEEQKDSINFLKEIDDLLDNATNVFKDVDSIIKLGKNLEDDANYLKPKIEQLETQLSEFSELAGLGLTAEALSHEVANIIDRLLTDTNDIRKKLNKSSSISKADIFIYIENIKSTISSLRKQVSHLAPSLKYIRESKEIISLENFLDDIQEFYENRFSANDITLITRNKKDFEIEINRGKLTQIFDNILLNSEYWLKQKSQKDDFNPTITIELSSPLVKIYDNGDGIDPNFDTKIFQPFITSKPKKEGRGLGLFIVKQLLETSNCDITLLNKKNNYDRKYIFQINFNSIV